MRYALLNNRNKSITIIKQVTGKINVSMVESLKKNLEKNQMYTITNLWKEKPLWSAGLLHTVSATSKPLCIDSLESSLSNSTGGMEDYPYRRFSFIWCFNDGAGKP